LIYTILTLFFFSFASCDRIPFNKYCRNMPRAIEGGTGEIINNVLFEKIYVVLKEGQIITSDSLNIFGLTISFDNGVTYIPIDFSKYSVLGKYAEGNSWELFFDRNVTKNIQKQKYIYTIRVISCGDWEVGASMNWVLIPKIEDNFSVEFIVEHKQWTRK